MARYRGYKYKFVYEHATGIAKVFIWKGWIKGNWDLLDAKTTKTDEKTAKAWANRLIEEHAKPERVTTAYYDEKGYEDAGSGW